MPRLTTARLGRIMALLFAGPSALLVAAPVGAAGRPLAIGLIGAGGSLTVTSSGFSANGPIPDVYSMHGAQHSPPLAWTSGPAGTRSFAVVMEDADRGAGAPTTHWLACDLAGTLTALPEGIPVEFRVPQPSLEQGANQRGVHGYMGPGAIGSPHHYHFQVFALDIRLPLVPASANRMSLLNAMRGHVLAAGDLVGTYAVPRTPVARRP